MQILIIHHPNILGIDNYQTLDKEYQMGMRGVNFNIYTDIKSFSKGSQF